METFWQIFVLYIDFFKFKISYLNFLYFYIFRVIFIHFCNVFALNSFKISSVLNSRLPYVRFFAYSKTSNRLYVSFLIIIIIIIRAKNISVQYETGLAIRKPGKREFKTEEILSETIAKAWEKWIKFTLNQIIREKKFERIAPRCLVRNISTT